jgi:hypothetical protein
VGSRYLLPLPLISPHPRVAVAPSPAMAAVALVEASAACVGSLISTSFMCVPTYARGILHSPLSHPADISCGYIYLFDGWANPASPTQVPA